MGKNEYYYTLKTVKVIKDHKLLKSHDEADNNYHMIDGSVSLSISICIAYFSIFFYKVYYKKIQQSNIPPFPKSPLVDRYIADGPASFAFYMDND